MSARIRSLATSLLPALLLTACLDFQEPEIPDRAAPAVVQAAVRAFDAGLLQVDGSLQPGRDSTGFQRVVQSPFIQANNFLVLPSSLGERGQRNYSQTFATAPRMTGGPFRITLPDVRDAGTMPTVLWNGLLRVDPDTIVAARGGDIVLHMDTIASPSTPAPFRQWFLDIRAGVRTFRISSDGLPPLTLRIPAEFIPPSGDPRAFISLIYFQTGQIRSSTQEYIGNVTLDVRLNWIVRFTGADVP